MIGNDGTLFSGNGEVSIEGNLEFGMECVVKLNISSLFVLDSIANLISHSGLGPNHLNQQRNFFNLEILCNYNKFYKVNR